jgi:GxxExxY protein
VLYKGQELCRQRLDMVVDERLIIETKSALDLPKTATRQLYNHLRATKLEIGLLFHFGVEPRFYRMVNQTARSSGIKNGGFETDDAD